MKEKGRLGRGFDDLKFRYKMMLLSMSMILVMGLVSVTGYQVSYSIYNNLLYRQTANTLAMYSHQIQTEMSSIEEISHGVATNPRIQEALGIISDEAAGEVAQTRAWNRIIQDLYGTIKPEILCFTLEGPNIAPIIVGLDSSREPPELIQRAKAGTKDQNGAGFWMTTGREDGSLLYVREIRRITEPYFLKSLGYLLIRVDYPRLIRNAGIDIALLRDQKLVITDETGGLFFSSQGTEEPAIREMERVQGDRQDFDIRTVAGEKLFLNHTTLPATRPALNIVVGLDYNLVYESMARTNAVTLLMMIGAMLFAVVVSGLAVKNMNRHFTGLVNKINRFTSGDLTPQPQSTYSKDEFGLLNRHFDRMTAELNTMIQDNYVKQLLIVQTKLKNLENQIHPHFLYNTLETVNWFAKRSGETHIPVIIDALSGLLHSNLSEKEDVVPLEKELALLERYITIQKIRYTDMLQVRQEIDPETLGVPIPKLSIQPLVENAISYSMEESLDGCSILVSSEIRGEEVVISVENDGSQIDEDILDRLRSHEAVANGHGVGLHNIDARLKLIFGASYGLTFINGDDRVTVEIHLPKEMLKEGNAEDGKETRKEDRMGREDWRS